MTTHLDRMKPSEAVAWLQRENRDLQAYSELLKGALAQAGLEVPKPHVLADAPSLTPQSRALLGLLFACYPTPVSQWDAINAIPGRDHAEDRQPHLVCVLVCKIRNALGRDAIQSIRGAGYVLAPWLHARIKAG